MSDVQRSSVPGVGIGLRQPHYREFMERQPPLAFVELHSENFFAQGGANRGFLRELREVCPVSLHGVGLSLGSAMGLDAWHLDRLAALVAETDPLFISDHASFARVPGFASGSTLHMNDLLPLAFSEAALDILVRNVAQVQERLGRRLLVENLSAYVSFADEDMSEPEFFNTLARRSGCGLLLDVNNLMVNALNRQPDAEGAMREVLQWLEAIDRGIVGEIHLAGHHAADGLVIDDHGSPVHEAVWQAYVHALRRLGPVPTLIEWDTALPPLTRLLDEAAIAQDHLGAAAADLAARQ